MIPIPIPVDPADCGTVEMLISPVGMDGTLVGRRMYAYYRPTKTEIAALLLGGHIEFCQIGAGVQPFSATVWAPPPPADETAAADEPAELGKPAEHNRLAEHCSERGSDSLWGARCPVCEPTEPKDGAK